MPEQVPPPVFNPAPDTSYQGLLRQFNALVAMVNSKDKQLAQLLSEQKEVA